MHKKRVIIIKHPLFIYLTSKEEAKQKILNWISKTKLLQITVFNTVANSLNYHLETIINFFIKRT
jgi:energy-converting hydrogenase A subunit M